MRVFSPAFSSCAVLFASVHALAQEPTPTPSPAPAPAAFDELSLEQLLQLDLKVVSVSKRVEALNDASAAVYAVTREEIRCTGHNLLPEALRVVPGVHVARFDSSGWAISARGFNGRFNTKMLVLMDGRSAYTPLFGGVFWDVQDTLLEDVERVEVIRGPGGTLWGANAVNGVVNVITRTAHDTQGLFAFAGGGSEERGFGGARFGGKLGTETAYRVYTKYHSIDDTVDATGGRHHDAWDQVRGGFRVDGALGEGTWTFQGDTYGGREKSFVVLDILEEPYSKVERAYTNLNGQNVLARYAVPISESLRLQVQTYWDRTERDDIRGDEWRQTGDADVQIAATLGSHRLVVGTGVRSTTNDWGDSPSLSLVPTHKTDTLYNLYVQDEWSLFEDALRLIVGSKFEHNDFTGFEVQPTARVTVRPTEDQTVWAAYSRAVRTPHRIERDGEVDFGINRDLGFPLFVIVEGNPEQQSEELHSVEAGYRTTLASRVIVDLAVYRNDYSKLASALSENGQLDELDDGNIFIAIPFSNEPGGTTWGGEASVRWVVTPQWTLAGGWSHFRGAFARESSGIEFSSPRDQASLRAYMDLSENIEWNIAWYWAGAYQEGTERTDPYSRIDVGWTVRGKRLSLDLWAQNLLAEQHAEVHSTFLFPSAEVQRSFYGRVSTRF